MAAQWWRVLHFTLLSKEETGMYMKHVRVLYKSESEHVDFLNMTLIEAKSIQYIAEVKSFISVIHFPDGTYHYLDLPCNDCTFFNPSCFLINQSVRPLPAGRRRWLPLLVITPMSPCCHPPAPTPLLCSTLIFSPLFD